VAIQLNANVVNQLLSEVMDYTGHGLYWFKT